MNNRHATCFLKYVPYILLKCSENVAFDLPSTLPKFTHALFISNLEGKISLPIVQVPENLSHAISELLGPSILDPPLSDVLNFSHGRPIS